MSDLMYTYTSEQRVTTEDGDAAPAIEVAATDRGRSAACLLVDEPGGLLWVADKEGWVYGEWCWSVGGSVEDSVVVRQGGQAGGWASRQVVIGRSVDRAAGCDRLQLHSLTASCAAAPFPLHTHTLTQPTTLAVSPPCRCGRATACTSSRHTGWGTSPSWHAPNAASCGPAPPAEASGAAGSGGGSTQQGQCCVGWGCVKGRAASARAC